MEYAPGGVLPTLTLDKGPMCERERARGGGPQVDLGAPTPQASFAGYPPVRPSRGATASGSSKAPLASQAVHAYSHRRSCPVRAGERAAKDGDLCSFNCRSRMRRCVGAGHSLLHPLAFQAAGVAKRIAGSPFWCVKRTTRGARLMSCFEA